MAFYRSDVQFQMQNTLSKFIRLFKNPNTEQGRLVFLIQCLSDNVTLLGDQPIVLLIDTFLYRNAHLKSDYHNYPAFYYPISAVLSCGRGRDRGGLRKDI